MKLKSAQPIRGAAVACQLLATGICYQLAQLGDEQKLPFQLLESLSTIAACMIIVALHRPYFRH